MSRKRGGLSDEDRRLWSQVAASAAPLPGKARRKLAPLAPTAKAPGPLPQTKPPPAPASKFELTAFRVGQTAAAPRESSSLAATPAQLLANAPIRMDHGTHRRMAKGKLAPEARIDLHGMTLAVAQPVLERFVTSSRVAGRRLVLVITGKGRKGGPDAPLLVRPGALRHYVPIWLHRPPLAGMVQQVTVAHLRHGGEGAYYVYLRK